MSGRETPHAARGGLLPVEVRALSKSFGEVRALDRVGLTVETGEIRGLLGANGAGKTTLLRILLGLIHPDGGTARVLGRPCADAHGTVPAGVAGFVETPAFYPYLSGRENLRLLGALHGGVDEVRVEDALELVGLGPRGGHKVGAYSTGMRQRLGIAASILASPRVLLLDEPTIGLDPVGARDVRRLLREIATRGVAVLWSSHNMTEVEQTCDTITVIAGGTVVWDGSVERLRREAPAPAFRLSTSDDDRALELAGVMPGVSVSVERPGELLVRAERERLDEYVIALGRAGVAARRLELVRSPVESMFFSLTGAAEDAAPEDVRADDVGRGVGEPR